MDGIGVHLACGPTNTPRLRQLSGVRTHRLNMGKTTDYNLQSLKAFLAVVGNGSMTAAARKLGLTQSAISQAIRQLEEALGTVVVDRSHRPLVLTPAGRALEQRARMLVRDADALASAVRHAGTVKIPELRIGAVDSFAATAGPRVIRGVLNLTSELSFRSGLARDQGAALIDRHVDLIITSDPMDDVDGLDRIHLMDEPYLLLVPKTFGVKEPLSDLKSLAAHHSLIRFSARSQVGAQVERQLRRMGVKAARRLEVDATNALIAMVSAGLGWAVVTPMCMLQVRGSLTGIVAAPFPGPDFLRQFYLITRAGEYGELAEKIAELAVAALREDCLPEMMKIAPWLKNQVNVPRYESAISVAIAQTKETT